MEAPMSDDDSVLLSCTIEPGGWVFGVEEHFTLGEALSYLGEVESLHPELIVNDYEDDPSFDWSAKCYLWRVYPNLKHRHLDAMHRHDERARRSMSVSYRDFQGWRPRHLKLLDEEHARRKQRRAAWETQREQIMMLLTALGASGAVVKRAHEEIIMALCSLPKRCVDMANDLLESIGFRNQKMLLSRKESGFCDWADRDNHSYPIISRFGAAPVAKGGEAIGDVIDRLKIDAEHFQRITNAWKESGGNASAFRTRIRRFLPSEKIEFVIHGLLPKKMVSVLVGPSGIGKSTLVLQMAACAALGVPFCGIPTLEQDSKRYAVYLSGEDPETIINERLDQLEKGLREPVERLIPLAEDYGDFKAALAAASEFDVALLIIDTAAAFCPQVNDTTSMREFANRLRKFAIEKDCAVLVIHHTNKGKAVGSAKAVLEAMKGSSELRGAARNVMALYEVGKQRELAIAKTNLPGSQKLLRRPLRLGYSPDTELHAPVEPPTLMTAAEAAGVETAHEASDAASVTAKPKADPLADARIVAAVVSNARAGGAKIARSGQHEPYNLKAPELAGWSRDRVRAAHKLAVESALLDA